MNRINKILFLALITLMVSFATISCNNNSATRNESGQVTDSAKQSLADEKDKGNTKPLIGKTDTFSIAQIIKDYLSLKNALASDDDKAAATAGKTLLATFNNVDMKTIPSDKHKEYMDIADDAKENAEHIGDNAGKIDHQREHLASLSKDVNDLISLFGTPQKLYQDYYPMFNDKKGAIWLSETKEIKNPYYGAKMSTCGSVQKELK